MSKILEYIEKHGLQALENKESLGLTIKRHSDSRVVINYSQIDSPKFDKLVIESDHLLCMSTIK